MALEMAMVIQAQALSTAVVNAFHTMFMDTKLKSLHARMQYYV